MVVCHFYKFLRRLVYVGFITKISIFLRKYWATKSLSKQKEMMKDYMLSLPTDELDNFMFSNIEKIKFGIESLAAEKQLDAHIKNQFTEQLDSIENKIRHFKQTLKAM